MSTLKGLEGYYNPPQSVPDQVMYYYTIAKKVESDALFLPIKFTVTANALTAISECDTAEQQYMAGAITTGARDIKLHAMLNKMALLLSEVQSAADNDAQNALDIFTRNLIPVRNYGKHQWESIEAKPGIHSGSFDLSMKPMDKEGAYLWMIREQGATDWEVAYHGPKHTGYCEGYTPGLNYEFYGQTSNPDGKSPLTQVFVVRCL